MAELGRALVTDARSSFGCVELLSEHQAASFLEPHSFLILQGRRAAGNRVRLRYTGAEPDKVVQHAYDLFNRRVKRTIDPDGAKGSTAIEQSIFVYQSEQIALHFDKTGAGDLAASDLTHRYLWGLVFDQILCDEGVSALNTAGSNLWPLGDHLDTVRDLAEYNSGTDTTTIANHRVFDSFGRLTSESVPAVTHLFYFTARPFDPATGLQNNLYRWYDPGVGRWLSEDPIGFEARDPNLYRYVGNTPLHFMDAYGLREREPWDVSGHYGALSDERSYHDCCFGCHGRPGPDVGRFPIPRIPRGGGDEYQTPFGAAGSFENASLFAAYVTGMAAGLSPLAENPRPCWALGNYMVNAFVWVRSALLYDRAYMNITVKSMASQENGVPNVAAPGGKLRPDIVLLRGPRPGAGPVYEIKPEAWATGAANVRTKSQLDKYVNCSNPPRCPPKWSLWLGTS